MKILHTADWHLGLRLGAHDLTDSQFAQVERLAQMCDDHKVDVLLVAGDVFERRTGLATLTKRLAAILKPRLERGLHVVLVPGNHDDREHFRMMRSLLNIEGAAGRLRVVETRDNFELCGVQWGVVPYPDRDTLGQYAADQSGVSTSGTRDRNESLSASYANIVKAVAAKFQPNRPAVFVAHVTVAGVETSSTLELSYDQDIVLDQNDLPPNTSYIALGHIHQAQQISGDTVVPCFYSGNIDRFNRGERRDEKKGAWLVEVPTDGPARSKVEMRWLDLPVTPFHDIEVSAGEVESLPERFPDLNQAFVHVALDCRGCDDPARARRRVYELCPHVLDIVMSGQHHATTSDATFAPRDWRQTALDYVDERFAGRPDLDDLKGKTQELLLEVENAVTSR